MNLTDSLKLWLADYIYNTDYEPGKSGTFEQRKIANEAWNNANWTAQKGGWGAEIRDSADDLVLTGSWQFKQSNGYWDNSQGIGNAITINRLAKRIFYYPLAWQSLGYTAKELAGYEGGPYDHKVIVKSIIACPICKPGSEPAPSPSPKPAPSPEPSPAPIPTPKPSPPTYYLPSPPPTEEKKKMECCDLIKELHKYLGIAKIKKEKFKISKTFLAPGGTGTEDCEDYYQLNQNLFRMLANGLILNPISQPLGKKWQSVNATAWAGDVYEMLAESMGDGNSGQKFQISAIMQLVQLLSIAAETSRKIEFVADVLGVEPDLKTEEIPACFTIFESHKGFEKKPAKPIDIGKARTDNEVEDVLDKMMKPSKIPIVKWAFNPNSISISAALRGNVS